MSQVGCVCGGAPLNSGTSGCIEQIKTWDYVMRVNIQDSTGAFNFIPKGTVLNQAFVRAKLNHIDPTIKWTVFPKIWAVEDVRADPLTETIDNIDFIEEQGPRTVAFNFIGKFAAPQMEATWNSFKCIDNAVFGLTSARQIEGTNPDLLGDLYPIKVQNDTWFAVYMKPKKAPEKQKVNCRFTVDETEKDATLDFIKSDSIAYSTDNWYSDSPIDVVGFEVSNSTTTIVLDLTERFGDVSKNKIPNLVAADFSTDNGATTSEVFNVTDSVSVALTSVVETVGTPGRYTLTFVLQTVADVIKVDIFKEGLDMREPLLVTIT